ncbi:sensor histidine kinase [Dinghuibacter silviterrae]|uniref:histidine kinase n=1 Tax=Dinghuibacter silviterrae TaxID=1539049 RepID=A0A4V3GLU7_9BACT|nr:histidine kinase [Dinghuibacter silviterrae]TDX00903.1 histidine kinase/DNA gyrase B/HSP90-like ATPase [Dinghuibacter silviterrae]
MEAVIVPFSIVLFIIAVGVVLLYQNFQKNLYQKELDNAAIKARQQEELLSNSIEVQEAERKRIAADMHDELGAVFSITRMNLLLLLKKEPSPEKIEALQKLVGLSETGLQTVRTISHQLMPPQLEAFGLVKTLSSIAETMNKAGHIQISFEQKSPLPVLEWMTTLGLYRIIMEWIANTVKHAGATEICIELAVVKETLYVTYMDNGRGLGPGDRQRAGMGFKNIEARVNAMKGTCYILVAPGFKAVIEIPV